MRMLLLLIIASLVTSSLVEAGENEIVGLTEDELISCAGFPTAQMELKGKTFYKFSTISESGAAVPAGGIVIFGKRQNGCEATVSVVNGRVVAVKTKRLNWSLPSLTACSRLFSACK